MWICPKCNRTFKTTNQSHNCMVKDAGELFVGKPDALVLAFDTLMHSVLDWEPCTMGVTKNAAVFTHRKAWLIVKPMAKELDLKFYYTEEIESALLKKQANYFGKYAYHIRIEDEAQVNGELLDLLRIGWAFGGN